jgi:ribA/ribD-fused uncharacterized protein
MTTAPILFYKSENPYYEFMNFYKLPTPITIDGKLWQTTEHYFQAMKFYIPSSPRYMEYVNIIQSTDGPMKAAILGRQKQKGGFAGDWKVNKETDTRTLNAVIKDYPDVTLRPDWEDVKVDIMRKALEAKFTQIPELTKLLKDTGSRELIEASPKDSYWGYGRDKKGQNMLGKLLMEIRSII